MCMCCKIDVGRVRFAERDLKVSVYNIYSIAEIEIFKFRVTIYNGQLK